jgi:hypothetical protein
MPLFEFLVEVMRRFGAVFQIDAWYFTAVQAIGFLPRDQIEAIMRAYGHAVSGPVCGVTAMADDGQFHRSVPWIWIAEPDAACPVSQLAYFLEHELHHVLVWIRDGLTVWEGHP